MKTGSRNDPYVVFRFNIEIGGLIVGGFSEVSGLEVEVETEDYKEGGVNDFVHKLPTSTSYQKLILKRGMTDSNELWDWFQNIVAGKIERKSCSVILMDPPGAEKLRWEFTDVFPVKWSGSNFQADTDAVAIETLEFVHHGFRRAGSGASSGGNLLSVNPNFSAEASVNFSAGISADFSAQASFSASASADFGF